jgi:hypothetical protein
VDLKVTFISERQEDYYTQRKFELQNLLVNIENKFEIENFFLLDR